MLGPILSNAIIVFAIMTLFGLLSLGARRPAMRDPKTGDLVLQCGPVLPWLMGVIAVGGPLGMGLLSLIIPFKYPAQVFVPITIGLFFLLLGGLISFWALRRRTRVGDMGITSEYLFAKPRFLPWAEVASLSCSNAQELWIRGKSGQKALIYSWFVGAGEAVSIVENNLSDAVKKESCAALARFAR